MLSKTGTCFSEVKIGGDPYPIVVEVVMTGVLRDEDPLKKDVPLTVAVLWDIEVGAFVRDVRVVLTVHVSRCARTGVRALHARTLAGRPIIQVQSQMNRAGPDGV